MKKHWISNRFGSLMYIIMAVLMLLACFACSEYDRTASIPVEDNILASEDHWVYPEGTSLIALDGSVFLDFPQGVVTTPTLFTISSVSLEENPREEYNSMKMGISIKNSVEDLVFGDFVNVRMNYAMDEFQRSAEVNEEYLTIYKMETIGTLSERLESLGQCCVDCSCKTVSGCISECGLYVVGELYVVFEVR